MAQEAVPRRLRFIRQWILEGVPLEDIAEAIEDPDGLDPEARGAFPVPDDDPWRSIERALELIDRQFPGHARRGAFHLAARQHLYAKCVGISDYKAALDILKDMARLEAGMLRKRRDEGEPAGEGKRGELIAL